MLDKETVKESSDINFEDTLRYVMLMLGIRAQNLPGEEETKVLINFIKSYYSNHTLSEIVLAFEMAIAGKLELGKEGAAHFENFSCEYFGRIMKSYRKWAHEESMYLPQQEKQIELPPTETDWNLIWLDYKDRCKGQDVEKIIIILPIYDWLVEEKIIELTVDQKKEIFQLAKNIYIQELQETPNVQNRELLSRLTDPEWRNDWDVVVNVQNRAKIMAVRNVLRQIKESENKAV